MIPCLAVLQNTEPSVRVNATFYRNSTAIRSPLPHHRLCVDGTQNVIGLIIAASGQDSHTTYHCVAGGLTSTEAAVYIGGRR